MEMGRETRAKWGEGEREKEDRKKLMIKNGF